MCWAALVSALRSLALIETDDVECASADHRDICGTVVLTIACGVLTERDVELPIFLNTVGSVLVSVEAYGGAEWVKSRLTEGLVAPRHDVLFASGDSVTTRQLVPIIARAIRLTRPTP